jgi:serine protease
MTRKYKRKHNSIARSKRTQEQIPERARVVVRFRNEAVVPYKDGIEKMAERHRLGPFKQLEEKYSKVKFFRMFPRHSQDELKNLTRPASHRDSAHESVKLANYFFVETADTDKLEELAKELRSWQQVQSAYVDRAGPDPVVNASDNPRWSSQGYLDPQPDGIDAEYAWGFAGGDGTDQYVIDLERGWTLTHEDLAAHGAKLLHGTLLDSSRGHGTSVLGELCAIDNTTGCVGIAPKVGMVNVVSFNGSTRADAILSAIDTLSWGDVLLLEAQVYLGDDYPNMLGPIEVYDAEFEVIQLATARGIIVVEAGGNGTNNGSTPAMDMNTYVNPSGLQILNRDPANPGFRDSGAIIVTAATSAAPHMRLPYAPHGNRIDCYAWGENIDTCSSDSDGDTKLYRTDFGGTSGASPIIAGAALLMQGIALASSGSKVGPNRMREILSDPTAGTAPAATETSHIGVMPDLRRIIDHILLASQQLSTSLTP